MEIDIVEQRIKDLSPALLKILLSDKTQKSLFDGGRTIIRSMVQSIIPIKK